MTPEETLKELHDTPGDLLTPVEIPGEFKPFANVDSTLIGNLANGKGDIVDGETDNINIVGPDGTGGNVETPEIDPATGQPIPPTQGGNEMEFNVSEFITTDLALSLLGFIIVFLGVLALNKFGKIQIENKELELTPEEKKTLKKPLDKCLESIKLKSVNPWVALLLCILVIYGLKFAAIIMAHKEKDKAIKSKEAELLEREAKIKKWEETPEERRQPYKPAEQQTITFTPVYENKNLTPLNSDPAPFGYGKDGLPKKDNRGRKPKAK